MILKTNTYFYISFLTEYICHFIHDSKKINMKCYQEYSYYRRLFSKDTRNRANSMPKNQTKSHISLNICNLFLLCVVSKKLHAFLHLILFLKGCILTLKSSKVPFQLGNDYKLLCLHIRQPILPTLYVT